ncbi:MAG: MFS transporter [Candidatus Omnitrophica bacterium]|nr:MFS transporter [Candidatus Omnitrophota bacterium]
MKQNKIKKSLRASILDGIFSSGMTGFINDYVTPYALVLGATNSQVGALNAVPTLGACFIQLKSASLAERLKSRKRLITLFAFLSFLILLPISVIWYLFPRHAVALLILFFTIYTCFNALTSPAWMSLMGEYIPARMRGKYFGWRARITFIALALAAYLSGLILHFFKNSVLKGFTIIFLLAFMSRIVSWYYLTRMYEPAFKPENREAFNLFDLVKRLWHSNFSRFVIFVGSLQFCVNLAAPFFSVFMLKDLKFNYIIYTILSTTVWITHVATISRWGRIADKAGNMRILKITSFIIASLPLWWILNQNVVFLVFMQALSGLAWAGFNLCATNFIYDMIAPEKRMRAMAYFNAFVGLAVSLGALLGGIIVNHLPNLFHYKILTLFLLASVLRFLVAFIFTPRIKEVRMAEQMSSKDVFYSVIGLKSVSFKDDGYA